MYHYRRIQNKNLNIIIQRRGKGWVRVLFHNLISPISTCIYTRRAFWARLSMLHVIEFNLWPLSSAPQSIEK